MCKTILNIWKYIFNHYARWSQFHANETINTATYSKVIISSTGCENRASHTKVIVDVCSVRVVNETWRNIVTGDGHCHRGCCKPGGHCRIVRHNHAELCTHHSAFYPDDCLIVLASLRDMLVNSWPTFWLNTTMETLFPYTTTTSLVVAWTLQKGTFTMLHLRKISLLANYFKLLFSQSACVSPLYLILTSQPTK